jgi:hypothetical protein
MPARGRRSSHILEERLNLVYHIVCRDPCSPYVRCLQPLTCQLHASLSPHNSDHHGRVATLSGAVS